MATKRDVMNLHKQLVSKGEYDAARVVMRFLRLRTITLGLSDVAERVDTALYDLGFRPRTSQSGGFCAYSLRA